MLPLTESQELMCAQEQIHSESHSSMSSVPGSRLLSILGGRGGDTFSASLEASHSQTMNTQPNPVAERMLVFRDHDLADEGDVQDDESRSFTFPLRSHHNESVHTERSPTVHETDLDRYTKIVPLRVEDGPVIFTSTTAPISTDSHYLVRQLQEMAAKRSALLDQLQSLHQQEADILAQIGQTTEAVSIHNRPISAPLRRPLNAPVLPAPSKSPSKVPRLQPSKASRHSLHTRTLSAPTESKPVRDGGRRTGEETINRVPLSEKPEEVTALRYHVRHSRSRSEVVASGHYTQQGAEGSQSDDLRGKMMAQHMTHHKEIGSTVARNDLFRETRNSARSRAQSGSSAKSQASIKSQGSTKSQANDKRHGQSKSRDSIKSRSRSESRRRGGGSAAVVQHPAVGEAKAAKVASRAHLNKTWDF